MADVKLEITIPEQHVERVINGFNSAKNKKIRIEIEQERSMGECFFVIEDVANENMMNFGKRVLRILCANMIRAVEELDANETYRVARKALERAVVDIPESIVE